MSEIGYCRRRDKRQLTEGEARSTASGVGGMTAYPCAICGHWHVASVGGGSHKKNKKRQLEGPEPNIFEVRTPDYEPDELVPGVPPDDFTGDVHAWYDKVMYLSGFGFPPRGATPMIRRADHARLIAELEP